MTLHTDEKSAIFQLMHSTLQQLHIGRFSCVNMCLFFCLQMTCGLKELLLNGQSQEPAVSLFPRLFSCLTVRLGASVGVSAAKCNNKHAASVHVAGWASLFS